MIKINLIPLELLKKERRRLRKVQLSMAAGFFLFSLLSISVFHWWRAHQQEVKFREMSAKLSKLQEIVTQVEQLEQTAAAVKARLQVITELLKGGLLYPYFMQDVAQNLPQGVWLTNLSTSLGPNNTLKVTTSASSFSSDDIADCINKFNATGRFSSIELGAIAGITAATGRMFNFSLIADYKHPSL